jgi:hypothetical protein
MRRGGGEGDCHQKRQGIRKSGQSAHRALLIGSRTLLVGCCFIKAGDLGDIVCPGL